MGALGLGLAALIGLTLGLLGGGGSILTVPVFAYVLGFGAKAAIAMSLAVVGAVSLFGAGRPLVGWECEGRDGRDLRIGGDGRNLRGRTARGLLQRRGTARPLRFGHAGRGGLRVPREDAGRDASRARSERRHGLLGTWLVQFVPAHALQRAFAVLLVVMGGFILYQNRGVLGLADAAGPAGISAAH
jgi:hypothetical protein